MERRIINALLICVVIFSGCYYDVAEELYPPTTCNTANMSYQANITPILVNNCYVCHSVADHQGDVTLEGYDELIKYVNSGQLLGAIKHESPYSFMPQDAPKLKDCDIAKIEQWIIDGAPNN